MPRLRADLRLYTQQAGTLEEVSHRSQRVVLMQGTAGQLIG